MAPDLPCIGLSVPVVVDGLWGVCDGVVSDMIDLGKSVLNVSPGKSGNPAVARERPIIFSGPMVRALLAGKKTMTRRLASSPLAKCRPGDRLWVRESGWWTTGIDHMAENKKQVGITAYRATFVGSSSPAADGKWHPSIHMPRWASRLTLVVGGVRIERLHDITEADARAEGCVPSYPFSDRDTARKDFMHLWNELHGSGSWEANPEVVAISFVPQTGPMELRERPNTDAAQEPTPGST